MKTSQSVSKGSGNIKHNKREQDIPTKNIDRDLSHFNVTLIDEPIKEVYHMVFDESVRAYNSRQKRNDRKINDYYSIVKRLDIVNRHDLKYIDQSNVESFKKEFDKYFKDLNEDVNILTDISTLPTTSVNKVGLIVVSSMITTIGIGAVVFTILKRKIYR